MGTRVRSYSKINLGLAIGPTRPDGFHELVTLYQTLELHDFVTVQAAPRAGGSRIRIECNHPGVPTDHRNTAWRIVESALLELKITADVLVLIDKRLPVQGGVGAGSANAVAALFGLEKELHLDLPRRARLRLAARIGSDVPLFLIGGAVLGEGHGEEVSPMRDLPDYDCVIVFPEVSVSTPQAFRDWDAKRAASLTVEDESANLRKLSLCLAASLGKPRSSGVLPAKEDLAEDPLLALVRTGIDNDFEQVVFSQYPLLGNIKRLLAVPDPEVPEQSAVYAALSGSGSAVFGLYTTTKAAETALRRCRESGIAAELTRTLSRVNYWRDMLVD